MKKNTPRIMSLLLLGGAGVGAAPMASAATLPPLPPPLTANSYVHVTTPAATKAGCVATIASDKIKINALTKGNATSGYTNIASVTSVSACELTQNGWQADVNYSNSAPYATGDQLASAPWAGELVKMNYTHGTLYHATTQADAQGHLTWALNQMKAKPDTAVVDGSRTYKNTDGTWSYEVRYHAKARTPFFGEDAKTAWAIA